jgi:hypothetical protein
MACPAVCYLPSAVPACNHDLAVIGQAFREDANEAKKRQSPPGATRPLWGALHLVSAYVMHAPDEFLERLKYFGFATDGNMLIRRRDR